jgi:biotin synthesis protein BioG
VKGEWIVREGRPELLLLFNGWGMDRRIADWMHASWADSGTHDLCLLSGYHDLSLPDGLAGEAAGYRAVDLVAWSLGVWAARNAGLDGIRRAVAVNGTPFPIDASRGIDPETFRGTLENWSDASRSRFERRMFAGSERDLRTAGLRSARETAEQQAELRAIAGTVASGNGGEPSGWSFSKAIVGSLDLVFLPARQRAAWQGTPTLLFDGMPHFPFFHLNSWQELLA